jgi:hypothetical protein
MWDISNVGHTLMLKSVSAALDLWRDTSFPRVLQDDQDMFRVYFGSIIQHQVFGCWLGTKESNL